MAWVATFLVAAAALSSTPGAEIAGAPGGYTVSAGVAAQILRPAIVRQNGGWEASADAPRPQFTRTDAEILIEFE